MTNLVFRPRARLLIQLGDQLIRNESVALLELIKNSYDAGATAVDVYLDAVDSAEYGAITICDNGSGMSLDTIKNVWMEPGTDYKSVALAKAIEEDSEEEDIQKPAKRLPLGEKGIGRFGAHKLGMEIELVSKTETDHEAFLKIDWTRFNEKSYLSEVPIQAVERSQPKVFVKGATGTRIIIKRLRVAWTRGMVRDIHRAITSLCSPFEGPDSFRVQLETDKKDWLKGLLSWSDIKEHSLFHVICEIKGNSISAFEYRFLPWATMHKLSERTITYQDELIQKKKLMVWPQKSVGISQKESLPIDLSQHSIGTVRIELLIFDRDAKTLQLGLQDKKGFKEYLDSNGGIRVYRDKMRVYDYGEPSNDWLGLDLRRVNIPTKRISRNIVLGAVGLARRNSRDLVEKSNREGFVENEAYEQLRRAVLYVIDLVEILRAPDKDAIRTCYGGGASREPVTQALNELKDAIEKKIQKTEIKQELLNYIVRVENDYKTVTDILTRSAGAGLSMSVAIHEMDKIIAELKRVVEKENPSRYIVQLVKRLADMVDGYASLVRASGKKNEDLKVLVERSLMYTDFRLKAHEVEIVRMYQEKLPQVRCVGNLVVGTLVNLIDNALWWLNYYQISPKKIFMGTFQYDQDSFCIVVADNGKGFVLPAEEIVKPFVSAKPDGMGLGLHIAHEAMKAQNAMLVFPAADDFDIPDEFKTGAIVGLCFKKGGK